MCFQKPLRDFALQNQVASQSAEMWCVFLLSPIETGTLNKHLLQTVPHDSETVTWGNSSLNNSLGTLKLLTLSLSRTSAFFWTRRVFLTDPLERELGKTSTCYSNISKLLSLTCGKASIVFYFPIQRLEQTLKDRLGKQLAQIRWVPLRGVRFNAVFLTAQR